MQGSVDSHFVYSGLSTNTSLQFTGKAASKGSVKSVNIWWSLPLWALYIRMHQIQ